MGVIGGLAGEESKGGLVAVASTPSVDAFVAERLILVAFDLPNSIAD